ncbi:hypothetical protein TRFO_40122 [Tritrichomonas foetus]|uniref:Uncharacterized protein n=1 Tax=Tritrichomonas foetus TaxID=1144522 RepID=A0A1J4J2C0_9EUKA|nr:hypothetical protein TRFO_40122 [Tritrichomonas foetus]|eukprot:OHS93600.1 hypothetical protein TRFO_40122 [Tritrichomonas foetus]
MIFYLSLIKVTLCDECLTGIIYVATEDGERTYDSAGINSVDYSKYPIKKTFLKIYGGFIANENGMHQICGNINIHNILIYNDKAKIKFTFNNSIVLTHEGEGEVCTSQYLKKGWSYPVRLETSSDIHCATIEILYAIESKGHKNKLLKNEIVTCEKYYREYVEPTKTFIPTYHFTPSNTFPKVTSLTFSHSNEFTSSKSFSQSKTFTQSDIFTGSQFFSESQSFTNTNNFSNSMFFTGSKEFSISNLFSDSSIFSRTKFFTSDVSIYHTDQSNKIKWNNWYYAICLVTGGILIGIIGTIIVCIMKKHKREVNEMSFQDLEVGLVNTTDFMYD